MERGEQGRFVKGVSGNPGGRPKVIENVRDLARQYTDDAIETLATIARNPNASDSARVQAASALLDRAWGKPHQYTESVNVKAGLNEFLDRVAAETRIDINDRNDGSDGNEQQYKAGVEDL